MLTEPLCGSMLIRHQFGLFIRPCVGKISREQASPPQHRPMTKDLGFGLTKFRCCRSRFNLTLDICSLHLGQGTRAILYLVHLLLLLSEGLPHLKSYSAPPS